MKATPSNERSGPPEKEKAASKLTELDAKNATVFWRYKRILTILFILMFIAAKALWITLKHLLGIAWTFARQPRALLALWKVIRAQRAVQRADEQRRLDRRWRP